MKKTKKTLQLRWVQTPSGLRMKWSVETPAKGSARPQPRAERLGAGTRCAANDRPQPRASARRATHRTGSAS